MNASTTPFRSPAPVRRVAATHIFAVGETVRLKGGFGMPAITAVETYRITATLPPRGTMLQYRIRNDEERYERVTTEDSLEAVGTPKPGAQSTLMERTFGQTDAQHARDQKIGAGKSGAKG